jgi:uncharacterized membrane protein YfhO
MLPGKCYPYMLSYPSILFCGIAGACMGYYLKHTGSVSFETPLFYLILCVSYGCSSYSILQETNVLTLAAFAVFPVVFLQFERMNRDDRYIPFVIADAILLLLAPSAAIPVTLLLFVLSLVENGLVHRLSLGQFLHLFLSFLLSFLLAACRIFFFMAPSFADHASYSYAGFSYSYDIAGFLERFFSGAPASRSFLYATNRMDLSVGLFCLLGCLVFFACRTISLQRRICYGVFTMLIILVLETSPFQYLFSLLCTRDMATMDDAFFLIFWMLYLAAQGMSQKKNLWQDIVKAGVVLLAVCGVVWWKCGDEFLSFLLPVHIILIVVYVIFRIWYSRNVMRHTGQLRAGLLLLAAVTLLELSGHIYLGTNALMLAIGVKEVNGTATDETGKNEDTEEVANDTYVAFVDSLKDEELKSVLSYLQGMDELTNEEKETYCGTVFPNVFENINGLCHKAGIEDDLFSPLDYTLDFTKEDDCVVTNQGYHIYNIDTTDAGRTDDQLTVSFRVSLQKKGKASVYQYDNYTNNILKLSKRIRNGFDEDYLQVSYSDTDTYNVQVLLYSMDDIVFKQVSSLVNQEGEDEEQDASKIIYDYIGAGITYVGLMILLLLLKYNDKEKLYAGLYQWKKNISSAKFPRKAYHYLQENKIYYLAFLLPVFFYIITMVVLDCAPFGDGSLLYSDGVSSSFPIFLDNYYKYKSDNAYLSMNGGYGQDLSLNLLVGAMSHIYRYLPVTSVATFMVILVVGCTGFCGTTMVYYMTHRLSSQKANKKDMRLLLPALVYAGNAYMMTFRCYPTWFLTMLLLPLVMLACDYLIYLKKPFLYSFLLGICILVEIQVALFVCIFLVIRFFTYQFDGWKDFFGKGIRFALASLFAGGLGFLSPFRTLVGYQDTVYETSDASFPSFGLHGSFLEEWKKLMIYAPTEAVTENDGGITLFCGILTLLLVLVYFTEKKISWKEKLRRLIPMLILFVSFNEQVLSYLWNGLHYQSNVPNRYVFLLMFLLAELAYEGLMFLKKASLRRISLIAIAMMLFFGICYHGSSENAETAFVCTLALCMGYLLIHLWYRYRRETTNWIPLLLLLFVIEVGSNACFNLSSDSQKVLSVRFGDYASQTEIFSRYLADGEDFYRCSYVANTTGVSYGQVYQTGGTSLFNSYLSNAQVRLQNQFGFSNGSNMIRVDQLSTPVGMSFSDSRYILCPLATEHSVLGLEDYTYIGFYNLYYIYENKNALSLGVYVPETNLNLSYSADAEGKELTQVLPEFYYNTRFYNDMAKLYDKDLQKIFYNRSLQYNTDDSVANTFYVTDETGASLSWEEAIGFLSDLEKSATLTMHVTFTAETAGQAYLNVGELVPLGTVSEGDVSPQGEKLLHYQISLGDFGLALLTDEYEIVIMDTDAATQFLATVQAQQMEDVTVQNDMVLGTTNYAEDGYTMLSLAFSKNWHAYIDGEEVEIEAPYDGGIYVKTPAGKHTLQLKYVPYGLKTGEIITLGVWVLFLVAVGGSFVWSYRAGKKIGKNI